MDFYSYLDPRSTDKKLGIQPFLHQLAVVASGNGQNLLRTSASNGTDEVSHLCHNSGCFNPDHVVVESKELNRARWACGGAFIVKATDGSVYHPCVHGAVEHRRSCLLPTFRMERGSYYVNTKTGPVVR